MDADRFDDLTRCLALRPTRRGPLGALAGLVAGLLGGGRARAPPAGQRPAAGSHPPPPRGIVGVPRAGAAANAGAPATSPHRSTPAQPPLQAAPFWPTIPFV